MIPTSGHARGGESWGRVIIFFFHYLSGERVLGCGLIGAIPVSFNFPLVESEYSCVYSYLLPSTRPTNGAIQVLYAIVEELTAQALASLQ